MIYSWPQAIVSALRTSAIEGDPPFGLIFASFMCALTTGSLFFSHFTSHGNSIQASRHGLQLALSLSALSLLLTVYFETAINRFWALCVYEFCLGFYFPSLGFLRSRIVGDANRSNVYVLMRVPLNCFVFLSLQTVQEGMLRVCCGLIARD